MDKIHTFKGRKIAPPDIFADMTVSQFMDFFGSTGYNARRLAEAGEMMVDMLRTKSTVCLTLAGAMTPIGMGKTIATMIKNGFIDWIVTTGANVYHDLHFAYGLPVRQGHFNVDDDILYSREIVRIYDVYIKEKGTLQAQDIILQNELRAGTNSGNSIPFALSTADITYLLGRAAKKTSPHPGQSFVVAAYESHVPVYIPAIGDSSIGLNMLPLMFDGRNELFPNIIMDVAESAAILWKSKRSGGVELGGGVPKNFFQQTGPALYQILKIKEGGHDYVIQVTDARSDTGGLSGATLQEGKSWGKIKTSHERNVTVYGDSSVYFPVLCSYVLSKCKPRKLQKVYLLKDSWVKEMKQQYRGTRRTR